ncbi:MAG: DegV family protein [Leptolinea sp.]
MVHIVTDGSVDMPEDWATKYCIHILPLMVRFGEKMYTSGVDIDPGNFYQLVRQYGIVPKTSLPSPGQIADFYRSFAKKGEEILSIHLSSKLSGTYSAVQLAAREVEKEFRIVTFDSMAGSAALGFMCREARLMAESGISLQKIIERLERIKDRLIVIFTLDTLEFARLNGRVSAIQSLVGTFLQIKPIIYLKDGLLEMGDKVRTRNHAIQRVMDQVNNRLGRVPVNVAVVHAGDTATALSLVEKVKEELNFREVVITDLAIPVAANLGPGTIGIVAYPVEEEEEL